MIKKFAFTEEEQEVDRALTMLPVWRRDIEEWRGYTADLKGRFFDGRVQHEPGDPTGDNAIDLLELPSALARRDAWIRCLDAALDRHEGARELCDLRLWQSGASVKHAARALHSDMSSVSRSYNLLVARLTASAVRAGLV